MELITEDAISLRKLAQVFEDAYMDVDKSNSERLRVEVGSCNVLVLFDDEKKILTFLSLWGLAPSSERDKHALANKLNEDFILVRFRTDSDTMWCDQQMLLKGGVSTKWLVFSLKRFGEVCSGAIRMNGEHFS